MYKIRLIKYTAAIEVRLFFAFLCKKWKPRNWRRQLNMYQPFYYDYNLRIIFETN